MTSGRVARVTIAACLLAAAATAVLVCTSTAGLTPGDLLGLPLVVGPYLLLAGLAWWRRGRPVAAWVVLAVTVGLAAWGLYGFGEDSYLYYTDPHHRMVQRMAVFVIPLVQWVAAAAVGLGLLVGWLAGRRGRS